jgi:ABC-type bacteriocin/lantibiotic exporter with double-glycine peptidase domain
VTVLLRQLTASRIRIKTLAAHKQLERFSRELYQILERMDLARLQSAEQCELERQQQCATEYRRAQRSLIIFRACVQEVHQTATLTGGVLAVMIGAALTNAAIGDLLAFFVGVVVMKNAVGKLISRYLSIVDGFAALRNIGTLLDRSVPIVHNERLLAAAPKTISLHCHRFGYAGEPLLCDVNLAIRRGTTLAITGRNGVGKSTLLYLLLGLHAPTDGRVMADGIPYEQLDLRSLRRHFGVVLQRPLLFEGTVRENLTFGAPHLSERRLIQAARIATADEFIRKLPQQYDTKIGEDGVLLSGGECQRLAIARALVRRPAFLLLDEPTNHLDSQTITQLLKKLERMPQRPAVVLISHDQHLVRFGAQVYVLESGRLSAAA